MTRDTSKETYKKINESGLLSKTRLMVYNELYNAGPLTGKEINLRLQTDSGHKRLSELRDRGVVQEVGTKICDVSGQKSIAWDVTSALPMKPEKRTKYQTKLSLVLGETGPRDNSLLLWIDNDIRLIPFTGNYREEIDGRVVTINVRPV